MPRIPSLSLFFGKPIDSSHIHLDPAEGLFTNQQKTKTSIQAYILLLLDTRTNNIHNFSELSRDDLYIRYAAMHIVALPITVSAA